MIRPIHVLCAAALLLLGCTADTNIPGVDIDAPSPVVLSYTRYGIPHLKADDFHGIGYGLGYAVTQENLCVMADWFLTVRGERTKYFGPDERYRSLFLIFDDGYATNFESDVYYRHAMNDFRLAELRAALSQEARDLVEGYADGYNRRLVEFGANTPAECRGEAWLQPISADDIYRRVYEYTLLAGFTPMLGNIAKNAPGEMRTAMVGTPPRPHKAYANGTSPASNAFAFGRETSVNGSGVMFANPHFPWFGPARRYIAHMTVGTDYNAFGAIGLGFPAITIGFNQDLAWSQTYSTDHRFAIYRLDLDPDVSNAVIIDGASVALDVSEISIDMPGGTSTTVNVYESPFGIMLDSEKFPWTDTHAYALMALNRDNYRTLDQYLAIGKARSTSAMKTALETHQGLQFSNIVSADRKGDILFANYSVAIDLDDTAIERCLAGDRGRAYFEDYDVLLLTGSTKACAPKVTADQIQSGVVPTGRKPFLIRTDYLLQSNDSHWILNADPKSYLSGFQRVIGDEGTQRGERLLAGLMMVEDRLAGRDGLAGNRFSPDAIESIFYQSRSYMATAMVDDIVDQCASNSATVSTSGKVIDLAKACDVLDKWDQTMRPDSVGALLFMEFMRALPQKIRTPYIPRGDLWDIPFDPESPLKTAKGVRQNPRILVALADAVEKMADNGFALDAPLRTYIYVDVNGQRISGSGGPYNLHMYRVDMTPGVGYVGVPRGGDTFIHATTFDNRGPVSKIVMGKSQATDPQSPYYLDQLPLYLKGTWFKAPFHEDDIVSDPAYQRIILNR